MSLTELSNRSSIPTPTAQYSRSIRQQNVMMTTYDGRNLPIFLHDRGASPDSYRKFLIQNRIGRVFNIKGQGGLERGTRVVVATTVNSFLKHPEF